MSWKDVFKDLSEMEGIVQSMEVKEYFNVDQDIFISTQYLRMKLIQRGNLKKLTKSLLQLNQAFGEI